MNKKSSVLINVLGEGQLIFEEMDSFLFNHPAAMVSLFETIQEVVGKEAANLVLETTGFRQGFAVGELLMEMEEVTVEELVELLPGISAASGWGQITFEDFNEGSKTLTARIKDTWEHKINVAQKKIEGSNLIPTYFSGIFTALYHTNIWHKVIHHQLEGHEYSEIEYFPSEVNVANNIHQLAKKNESAQIFQLEALVEDKVRDLTGLVKELSSPIIPVLEGVVVVPLIGKFDENRARDLVEKTLNDLPSHEARYLILDLTGIHHEVGSCKASTLEHLGLAASLMGIETVFVGIAPQLSIVINQSVADLSKHHCFQTLQHAIHYALGQQGKRII